MVKTRKRSKPPVQITDPESTYGNHHARTKRARLPQLSCSQLRQRGFTILRASSDESAALTIAAAALQSQLKLCSNQPEHARFAGYKAFPCKQILEYQAGMSLAQALPVLQHVAIEAIQAFDGLARDVLAQLAQQLKLAPDAFVSLLDTPLAANHGGMAGSSSLDTIHYMAPSIRGPAADVDASANCGAHVDKGLLTLIFPDTEQGLQVKTADGSWEQLLVPQGHIAVLAGYTLERATCGLVQAVTHRVVMGQGGCGTARQVLAYKLRAASDAVIDAYQSMSCSHADINSRFEKSIGVRELMHFFEATHRSINALQSAPMAATSTSPNELTAIPRVSQPERHGTLQITVRGLDGSEALFKLRDDTVLYVLFDVYVKRKGLELADMNFMYEGCVISQAHTCRHYEIEDGDTIDAMVHQVGD